MVEVVCPHCSGIFVAEPGQSVLCPHCKNHAGTVPGGADDGAEGGFGVGGVEQQLMLADRLPAPEPEDGESHNDVESDGADPAAGGPDEIGGFAVASLVLGLCFFIPVGGIAAVIFGLIYLSQDRPADDGGRGMAIAGIIFGGLFQLVWFTLLIMMLAGIGNVLENLGGGGR